MRKWMLVAAMVATPAGSEVKSATSFGFEVETRAVVAAGPAEAYAALTRPASWWNGAHGYSGDADNLSLDARAGGCFCEALPRGGGVEHMRVVYAERGVTLQAAGRPGAAPSPSSGGNAHFGAEKVNGGTQITETYVVGGYLRMGAEKPAPLADQCSPSSLPGFRQSSGVGVEVPGTALPGTVTRRP